MERKSEFAALRDILDRGAMKQIRERNRMEGGRAAWKEAVGDEIARRTRVGRYRDGKLVVEVFSPSLLLELSSFRKRELLARLRQHEDFKNLTDLVFKNA